MNYEEKITLDVLQSQAMVFRVCHTSEESGFFLMHSLYLFQKYVLFKDWNGTNKKQCIFCMLKI